VYNQIWQRSQQHAPLVVVGLLQAHWQHLVGLSLVVPDDVTSHMRLDQVVLTTLHVADAEHKVEASLMLTDDRMRTEKDCVRSTLRSGKPDKDSTNDDRVQEKLKDGLRRDNDSTFPTTIVIGIWHSVTDGHHGFHREIICLYEATFKL
jgi:hypothetical protein